MIDREGSGAGLFSRKRHSRGSSDDFWDQSGISNKTIVYLVIMALIVILCIVYVFQLKKSRAEGQSPETAVVTADTAVTAATAATAEHAAAEEEAVADTAAEAEGASTDAEDAQAPAE